MQTVNINSKTNSILEQIKLNKENPAREFKLNSAESYILIHRVEVTSSRDSKNEWRNFTSQVKLCAELKYEVLDDTQQRFIDERKIHCPIHLIVDPYQTQPIFELDRLIKNQTFTVGVNSNQKSFSKLILKIQDPEILDKEYSLFRHYGLNSGISAPIGGARISAAPWTTWMIRRNALIL